ncbi:MAG: VCBS repeat-containing protein, partial [Proteobacteria bacterium]|nr:VCBS repeat-containing protein [Pseudomonadota bacterium]
VNSHTGFSATGYVGSVSWIDVTAAGGLINFNRTVIDPVSVRAFDVNTIDVNGDGKKDVIVSTFMDYGIYWYEQPANSGGSWIKHFVSETYDGTDMYTGDIDGNGKTDLIVSGLFENTVSWFSYSWENGQALWTEHSLDNNINYPGDISLNDIDGDGVLDVVVAGMGDNQIVWYKNKLYTPTTTTTIIPTTTTTTVPATVIQLSYFAATPKAGKVILQWNTEAEIDNAGFNIYRAESETGKYSRINDSLVPAKGSSTQGASYEFTDTDVQNRKTYYYKLEDIDLSGKSTMHGPVSAMPRLLFGILK